MAALTVARSSSEVLRDIRDLLIALVEARWEAIAIRLEGPLVDLERRGKIEKGYTYSGENVTLLTGRN